MIIKATHILVNLGWFLHVLAFPNRAPRIEAFLAHNFLAVLLCKDRFM